jgi:hypothetical protein
MHNKHRSQLGKTKLPHSHNGKTKKLNKKECILFTVRHDKPSLENQSRSSMHDARRRSGDESVTSTLLCPDNASMAVWSRATLTSAGRIDGKRMMRGGERKAFKPAIVLSYLIICIKVYHIFDVLIQLHA